MSRISDHPIDLASHAAPVGGGQVAFSHREGPLYVEIDVDRGVVRDEQHAQQLPPTYQATYNAALSRRLHQLLTLPIGVVYNLSFSSPYTPHHDLHSSIQGTLGPTLPSLISIDPLIHTASAMLAVTLIPGKAPAGRRCMMMKYSPFRVPARPAEQQKSVTEYCELLFSRTPPPIQDLVATYSRPMAVIRELQKHLTNLEALVAKPHTKLQRGHYVALAAIYRSHFEAQVAIAPAPVRALPLVGHTRTRFNAFKTTHS